MRQELEDYIQKRRKLAGGFSATPRLPATIQDTYHALRILTCLDKQDHASSDGPLRDYLTQAGQAESHSAKVSFQRLACYRMAGEEVPRQQVLDFVRRRLTETQALEERYYCCRLIREHAGYDDETEFNWLPGPFSDWPFRTVSELWMLLFLAHRKPDNHEALTAWLQDCQTGDGGFGFLPSTTSFMENCYDCLRALRWLGSSPRSPQACREFVLACRTKTGGFARRNGATAFLSSTWQAVACLDLMGGCASI